MPESSSEPNTGEHHLLDDLRRAAIEAEFDTGRREDTVEEARANVFVRIARMTAGFIVLLIGIVLIPLPGPGWLVVAAGLAILAKDVAWADRLLRYVRRRVPGVPEDGKIPRSTWITIIVMAMVGVAVSLWWTLGR